MYEVGRYRTSVTSDYVHWVNVVEALWPVFVHAVWDWWLNSMRHLMMWASIIRCELCGWPMAFLETWLHMLASRIRHELYGWPMAFLRKLATCARKLNWVWAMWLANAIPREIGCMCWPVELGMSYMAGQRHSWGIWYLCLQMGMSYVAG